MITLQIKKGTDIPIFECKCGREDVAYSNMPQWCYWCKGVFLYDVLALLNYKAARIHFYYDGRTMDEETYRRLALNAKNINPN